MKLFIAIATILVAASSAQYLDQEIVDEAYPQWSYLSYDNPRHRGRRDVTYDRKVGENGKIFGTLGQNDQGLFGKGGYEHQIFNDNRGTLTGQAHGTRVLGPNGDSSHLGGTLNWKNPNAAASLDVSKQIHGPTSVNAAAGGRWPVGKNGDFTVQGFYDRTSGRGSDYGGKANINYRW